MANNVKTFGTWTVVVNARPSQTAHFCFLKTCLLEPLATWSLNPWLLGA
jgi:hypothetical protein